MIALCVNGVYAIESTAVSASSTVARSMPVHRVSLLSLMSTTLGNDNVWRGLIVREKEPLCRVEICSGFCKFL